MRAEKLGVCTFVLPRQRRRPLLSIVDCVDFYIWLCLSSAPSRKGGFEMQYNAESAPTQRLKLLSVPYSHNTVFGEDDVIQMITELRATISRGGFVPEGTNHFHSTFPLQEEPPPHRVSFWVMNPPIFLSPRLHCFPFLFDK